VGYTDLYRGPHRRRHDRALGHQGRDASRDIFFENALPVIDGPAFAAYVEKELAPELGPSTVVILDNLATHKNAVAAKAMGDADCWFLFLPPYSPDLNPIEMAFSKLKAHLRRIGARTFTDMFDAIAEVCELYSPQECWNNFKVAGCVSG
jgi:transposase